MQCNGEINIEWNEGLLIVSPQGPFNDAGLVEDIDKVKNAILIKNSKKWSRLEVWREETLGSPVVMESAKKLYLWCTLHGCIATAIVIENSLQRSLIEKGSSGNIGVFNNKYEAIDWVKEKETNKSQNHTNDLLIH